MYNPYDFDPNMQQGNMQQRKKTLTDLVNDNAGEMRNYFEGNLGQARGYYDQAKKTLGDMAQSRFKQYMDPVAKGIQERTAGINEAMGSYLSPIVDKFKSNVGNAISLSSLFGG